MEKNEGDIRKKNEGKGRKGKGRKKVATRK